MPRIKITHSLGKVLCETAEEAERVLSQTVDGVNDFFIVREHTIYPHFTVLVKGPWAYVTCVPSETAFGLQAFADEAQTGLDPDGTSFFFSREFSEELEVSNDYVIPKKLAADIVREFAESGTISQRVRWEEVR